MRDIFTEVAAKMDTTYVVKVSFVELYNEQLFDLLSSKTSCQFNKNYRL